MVNATATDWTITVQERQLYVGSLGAKKRNRVKLSLPTTAAGTDYAAGGVPVPTASLLGLVRNLDYINVFDDAASVSTARMYKYGVSANVIKIFRSSGATAAGTDFAEMTTATIVAPVLLYVEAVGW